MNLQKANNSISALRLTVLSLAHTTIDHYATFLAPLFIILAHRVKLSEVNAPWLISIFVFTTSFAQPLFGYISDRFGGRWLMILAPAVAGICFGGLLGITSLPLLLLAIFIGSTAIAAFHPEGAATAQTFGKSSSTFSTSIFIAAGPVGLSLGPKIATSAATNHVPVWWLMVAGILFSIILFFCFPSNISRRKKAQSNSDFLNAFSGKWHTVAKLVTISSIRAFVTIGLETGFTQALSNRLGATEALPTIGNWISILLGFGAFGGVILSLFLTPRFEKAAMLLTLGLAIPLLGFLPYSTGATTLILLALGGFCLGATNPLTVALGQRVVPKGTGIASALMLGFSWGTGGTLAPQVFQFASKTWGNETGTLVIVLFLIVAFIAALMLKQEEIQPVHGELNHSE